MSKRWKMQMLTGRKSEKNTQGRRDKEMFSYLFDDGAEAFTGRCKGPSPLLDKRSQIVKELKHSSSLFHTGQNIYIHIHDLMTGLM